MGAETKIQWCDHTFNPWRGCTKVSPGCAHCYAETMSKRNPAVLGVWGNDGTRVVAADSYWREPLKWNQAAAHGVCVECGTPCRNTGIAIDCECGQIGAVGRVRRPRVFCASLADVFEDRPELVAPRRRLFELIAATPHLDWLLLTKRPENIIRLWPGTGDAAPAMHEDENGNRVLRNVWLGVSVEDQPRADERIPQLLATPALVRFLSCEPLLGPINLDAALRFPRFDACPRCMPPGDPCCPYCCGSFGVPAGDRVEWVIVGGESGPKARPCNVAWVRSIVEQCKAAGVACFVKQLGANVWGEMFGQDGSTWPKGTMLDGTTPVRESRHGVFADARFRLRDPKGGDPEEWPEELRVRELPR